MDEAAETYGFERNSIIAIDYPNGANIAASLLFQCQHTLKAAVLHHPMVLISSGSITLKNKG